MANRTIQGLREAGKGMSRTEAIIKLVITLAFVPIPILAGGLGGFWLDYYRFNTLPLLVIVGTLLGTLTSFLGVWGIVVYRRKAGAR